MESNADPYGYLVKGDFTSELYKLEIKNLHHKVGFSQLKQRLKSIGLNPHKVKIVKDISFVTFKSADERDEAIQKINGHNFKGNTLLAKIAKGRADPYLQKRKEIEDNNDTENPKKMKMDLEEDNRSDEEKLKDHVVKFWRKPYENQLIAKENKIQGILQNLYLKINKENVLVKVSKNYISQINENNVICPIIPIMKSPIQTAYRNKCEFTIGMTLDKKGPIAGFCHGKYRGGFDAVGDARCLSIIPHQMSIVIDHLNELFSQITCEKFTTTLAVFTPGTDKGHLRGVTLRTGSINFDESLEEPSDSIQPSSLLMIVDIHPQDLPESDIQSIGDFFTQYFYRGGKGEQCGVTSLLLTTRKNNSDPLDMTTTKILFGSGFVYERLMKLSFRISYNAFFQVNTLAAETLYSTIRDLLTNHILSNIQKKVTLLDVCCGTGTIALCMADLVESVIGVEMCAESVEDAKFNAKLNNITNTRFIVGKAEDVLSNLLTVEERAQTTHDREFIAIVDPPRAGLHSNVIQAIRRCDLIKKVIFVSCNPEAAYNNFIDFARPVSKRTHGCPFIPELSVPVDLFPQTSHVELVVLLTRLSSV